MATVRQDLQAKLAKIDKALERARFVASESAVRLPPSPQANAAIEELIESRDAARRQLRAADLAPPPGDPPVPRDVATPEIGVLLPLRIETRFKNGDLHIRVVPDEPWFVRDDPLVSVDEVDALRRYVTAANNAATADAGKIAWRELATHIAPPRAVYLHRLYVTSAPDGTRTLREPTPGELRVDPAFPKIVSVPDQLTVWLAVDGAAPKSVLTLRGDRSRLLADFADPDTPGDRRWWDDWEEALIVGMAGVVPKDALTGPIDALFVTGLSDDSPSKLFGKLAAEGRLGVLTPGFATNSVDGAPAAPLATDADTWLSVLQAPLSDQDADISRALTGDSLRLGALPGGAGDHRRAASSLVTALWPALWGFAASRVWNVARGNLPALWAKHALYPEGPYPLLRVGPQPYGLLPTTAWRKWRADPDDPSLEPALVKALLALRSGHSGVARARGTAAGQSPEGLLELIGQTPTSSRFRYRATWPLELWWLGAVSSRVPVAWRDFANSWRQAYPLVGNLGLDAIRRYGARGQSRLVGIPLVVPPGAGHEAVGSLLTRLATTAVEAPRMFARTTVLDQDALERRADSLLLRLVIRSLQLLLADVRREQLGIDGLDLEPFARPDRQLGRIEELVLATTVDTENPTPAVERLLDATDAIRALAGLPVATLERMLSAAIDSASHRIDPWLVGVAQRRFDALQDNGARWRIGAYGWVDAPRQGAPGPTAGGLVLAPSPGQALAAAVLRDRAVNDVGDPRWELDITSRRARVAERIAEHVRVGAHLSEALGREIERVVGVGVDVERLRTGFAVRTENAGRRVCDGVKVLAADPFPVQLDDAQAAAITELREALDTYGDLLVADAVHHLAEGRPEVASAVMDGAAGLARPPDLALLRTPREGRAVTTSAVIALPHVAQPELPAGDADRALLSPATVVDASAAAFLLAELGDPEQWTLQIHRVDDAGHAVGAPTTITLDHLGLHPADALALTRTALERLAMDAAAEQLDLDPRVDRVAVVGGSAGDRYEVAARVVGLLGRSLGGPAAVAEQAVDGDDPVALRIAVARLLDARQVGDALARALRSEVGRLGGDGTLGTADAATLRRLLGRCWAWGIAPDVPMVALDGATSPADARVRLMISAAVRALAQLGSRLDEVSAEEAELQALGRDDLLARTVRLLSPTGQLAVTDDLSATRLPTLSRSADLDHEWLTITAAVRPALARLELHQLAAEQPLVAWTNRPDDPWQRNDGDHRSLVAVYAPVGFDLATLAASDRVAVAAVDRFSEVVPSSALHVGAAFGFDAPAARAQQAILLAVPPVTTEPLTDETLVDILVETRELAQARMARPIDLGGEFWGIGPTALLPASGADASPLELDQ